jgi:SAM-dependent methyltransferase
MKKFDNNFWDERYSSEEFIYGKEPNEFFKQNIEKLNPGKLLLPGEGEGRNAVFAARLGWIVDATDQSKVAKQKAERLADEFKVKINYTVCDISEYEFPDNYYDVVALIFFHKPPDLRKNIHRKIISALKPNGMLIFEKFSKEQLGKDSGGPQNIDMLYSIEDIERDFHSLKTVLLEDNIITLNEGPKHSGEASVIRYIGIKK